MIYSETEKLIISPCFDAGVYQGKFVINHIDIPQIWDENSKKFYEIFCVNITKALYKSLNQYEKLKDHV